MIRPSENDYPAYAKNYVSLVKGDSVAEIIALHNEELLSFVESLPDTKANYAYAENKWSVKEVLQHIIDTERVFSYRALALARGEKQSLPGFEQNDYAAQSFANTRAFSDLKEEYFALRFASNILFRSFRPSALTNRGLINNYEVSCLAIIYMTFGHALHHKRILINNYL
ncbi:DinB family protein [Arachidicoccus sp.]|uniref:DinB family protein n=1 Tax=Arachidicoccus sp. TaxID=1872624 RepID=UPI003D25C9DE